MNNMNFDENTINKLKDMMNKGELNDVMSQISPEMIQNFSSMMSQNQENNSRNTSNNTNNANNPYNTSNNTNNNSNFDFSQIDMNTILKMKSVMEKLNTSNDPRSNLLYSLKPYLREEKKEKIDQYASLLNVAKIADLLKDNKENPHNG